MFFSELIDLKAIMDKVRWVKYIRIHTNRDIKLTIALFVSRLEV